MNPLDNRTLMADPEVEAKARLALSRHRRELEARRETRRRRLRTAFAVPAALGWTIAIMQVVQPDPNDALTLTAALASVPFLATFDLLRGNAHLRNGR